MVLPWSALFPIRRSSRRIYDDSYNVQFPIGTVAGAAWELGTLEEEGSNEEPLANARIDKCMGGNICSSSCRLVGIDTFGHSSPA